MVEQSTAGQVAGTRAGDGSPSQGSLHRSLDWRGAFWVAAGVPPLVLFSIGGIAGVAGKAAFVVWMLSMVMGFLQSFTYAEMAGMFGNKSGGASVYGATAWLRYSKLIAPLSVWCNWFAWSPVLSLGCAIAVGVLVATRPLRRGEGVARDRAHLHLVLLAGIGSHAVGGALELGKRPEAGVLG